MIVFPAIDLRRGRCVRLRQGDPAAETVFDDDPAGVARCWADLGAEWLHVVNLDGALGDQDATAPNLRRLAAIRQSVSLPIQFGGGLRTLGDVERVLALGVTRVVVGTAALVNPSLVTQIVEHLGAERLVIGLDAREGRVATHGWQETSGTGVLQVARQMRVLGVLRAVYTDIARDGMLSGVDAAGSARLARHSGLRIIASGGVRDLEDIRQLVALEDDGIEGVITGQAIYTGALSLSQAIAEARARSQVVDQG
jgi:phosphoribosylformimino-5-aminoimidazole carboxamide ribotide isomerase